MRSEREWRGRGERDGGKGRWRLRGEGRGKERGGRGLKVVGRERALGAAADATKESTKRLTNSTT